MEAGLLIYDDQIGIGWKRQSADGAMTKSPLGRRNPEKSGRSRKNPTGRGKIGVKRSILTDHNRIPIRFGFVTDKANQHDVKLDRATLKSIPLERPAVKPLIISIFVLTRGMLGAK